jgi:hypothetical protein
MRPKFLKFERDQNVVEKFWNGINKSEKLWDPYWNLAVKFERHFELILSVWAKFCTVSFNSWTKSFALHEYCSYLMPFISSIQLVTNILARWWKLVTYKLKNVFTIDLRCYRCGDKAIMGVNEHDEENFHFCLQDGKKCSWGQIHNTLFSS